MVHRNVKQSLSLVSAMAILTVLGLSLPMPVRADEQDLAKYFKGKTVEIVVGSSPGGGYDVFSRLTARFISKYLPAEPRAVIVLNVPGGGGLRGLRTTMKARPDGLTVGTLNPRMVVQELLGKDVPDLDLNTVRYLGSHSGAAKRQRMVCVRRDTAASWEEVQKLGRPITLGASGPGSIGTIGGEFVQLIGGPIKMVFGYGGVSESMAAFDRGELDATERCTEEYVPRMYPEWIKKKVLAPVFWWEGKPSKDWMGQLGVPMPPYLFDVVRATQEQKKAFEVMVGILGTMTRAFVMPAGVPDNIYKAWRKAFEATGRDPDFLKGADVAGLEVGLATADDFEQIIGEFRKLSSKGVDIVRKLARVD